MTQEEKAKAYDRVSKEVKDFFWGRQKMYSDVSQTLEYLFPELKESEDERIRKALLGYFNEQCDMSDWNGVYGYEVVAWLEKQGEQKPFDYENATIRYKDFEDIPFGAKDSELQEATYFIPEGFHAEIEGDKVAIKKDEQKPHYSIGDVLCDKSCTTLNKDAQSNFEITDIRNGMYICDKGCFPISQQDEYELIAKRIEQKLTDEPKFKVGDWIVNDYCIGKVIELTDDAYLLDTGQGIPFSCEHNVHLWTIQDAKDGDVLAEDTCTFIIKKLNHDFTAEIYCCLYDDGDFELNSNLGFDDACTYPATKEQRNLLFSKMKEAGYEWDAEKKELKNIEQKPTGFKIGDDITVNGEVCKVVAVKQKPAWSEEDENMFKSLNKLLNEASCYSCTEGVNKILSWLKSLKNRVLPQPKQEWSEEDEHRIELLKALCEDKFLESAPNSTMYEEMKTTINWLKSLRPQPKQECSEEDKRILDALITSLINERFAGRLEFLKGIKVSLVIDWLKSLKEKIKGE